MSSALRSTGLALLSVLALTGCYHSVPTNEPGRELWKVRLTSGEEIEFPRHHRAYWQDTVVVVEQHAGDEEPRIIPGSQIAQSWTREIETGATKFVLWFTAGALVIFAFLSNIAPST